MGQQTHNDEIPLEVNVYVTNGLRLYEVSVVEKDRVCIRNVVTEQAFWLPRADVEPWERYLPSCPDSVDSLV